MNLEKTFLKTFLKNFEEESFQVNFWDGEELLIGNGEPQFKVLINKPIDKKALLNSTSLAFGEAYMDGDVEFDGDLFLVLNTILKYINKFNTNHKALPQIFHKVTNKSKQKEEVTSHYDIGNDFYSIWLDKTMSYSCGYFKNENDSLEEAQMNKINHILKKLNLQEGQSLLDIGCGWGTLLIEAAKQYKVRGLGITLSEEQYKKFSERIKEEHLEDLLEVKIMDYRDLKKSHLTFDRVVSVGMLEHVGRPNYNLFFENVDSVLVESGVFLLHYISGLKESEGDAFIKKYIFPGGVIPSLREIINISAEYDYHTIDIESLRLHYTKTLLEWYKNFSDNIDKVKEMFDERFIRMWSLYLCSCAATFNNGVIDLHQILFTKGVNNKLPLTREYLYSK
ncbi:cyclopropane-fatty-acyl-phospholipid synthase family protein [Clostridium celatum]|uniref:Putative cyclopropane-fatty-acyl-phospholipid synthase n=1 Tax=Clostridium celatum DSM 1785 TaxID=545697 RepID=L1QL00_9CLOT|nr:cyclopropane-fatty-acyl-phospholipid synthase family protein [Clostridium celatum]EKY28370.1 putative cyclopropane-fatty-acyl-phospholipid synthase [Clostridium celatum DSM 1785]MCE9655232.1 cyclopropane-fatty-acyl-phospholipid synthase family protein [Clostridium celatum]MDU2266660.1 cyclopropane-fatty-acyl-phospholipid synthase family protein [Clostridium celatum]MDU3723144.1 cyclopropane-fatty-acyl-phospholipid synthase family protein [Clostridium celatum]MDU6297042.1 cyclopropane-fatty-